MIVPVYNTENYIRRCLDSLVYDEKVLDMLDIVLVNDGSSDNSLKVIEKYKKSNSSVRLINKENGGHGSAINAGFNVAKGRFIKILDSDDWVNIHDFSDFVLRLSKEEADIVVTNYKRDLVYEEKEIDFVFSDDNREICEIGEEKKEIDSPNFFFKFSMPSMAVRKSVLDKVWGRGLLEKTFYVDQQFVFKVLAASRDFSIYNLDIYRHFIGRPGQSVELEGFYNHRDDHERVLKELLKGYLELNDDSKAVILGKQISLMLDTHYAIYKGRRKALKELERFDDYLKVRFNSFYDKKRIVGVRKKLL